jgi:hypothetical protein
MISIPIDCRAIIDLREGRFWRSGRIVASYTLDLSFVTDKGEHAQVYLKRGPPSPMVFIPAEIRLDLKDDANDKVGDLTICVASSLASPIDAIESANRTNQGQRCQSRYRHGCNGS